MFLKTLFKEIIVDNQGFIEKQLGSPVSREIFENLSPGERVNVIHGVRRCGKTYLLYEIFQDHPDDSLYIDFEDERLTGFRVGDFETLREAFGELRPGLLNGKKPRFLFDEIQRVEGWERFARRMFEKEGAILTVAGSSTKIHPESIGTSLRGRFSAFELFPFSFREFLRAQGFTEKAEAAFFGTGKIAVKRYFDQYLRWGGFPEVSSVELEKDKKRIIKDYLNAMYFRDLVERFEIKNFALFNALWDMVFSSFARQFSVNTFANKYRNEFPFSKDLLYAYYRNLVESRLVWEVKKFAESSYRRFRTPGKIYLVDNGLARKVASQDWGRLLKNAVLIELKRRGSDIYYFAGKNECDFIVAEDGAKAAFQVVYEMDENNRKREILGIIEACKTLGLKEGTILSGDQEDELKQEGVVLNIKPVWKWMLQE